MDIAIIGGGIGGLAVAFNIVQYAQQKGAPVPNVTVYEATGRFGGNGDTVAFNLGQQGGSTNPSATLTRWADLGVNDFNATAYTRIVNVMKQIGFTGYSLLEDTTTYYTLDGKTVYSDGDFAWKSPMTAMPDALGHAVDAFMKQAAADALNPVYVDYSVQKYIDEVFSQNPAYDARLGPCIIYPRVNAMYFTDEIAPRDLPLRAVMHYYSIQEGAGGAAAQRMYFVDGAGSWIDALTAYMQNTLGIKLVANCRAMADKAAGGGWNVYNAYTLPIIPPPPPVHADIVVVATHADDAAKLLVDGVPTEVLNILSQVKYLNGISVAHTFGGMFPPDYNGWATYNILIREDATYLKPYSISYVCNRHQNDAASSQYNVFGWPMFFVTVNPPVPVPLQYVLTDKNTGKPAIANLRHNVFDFACLRAQAMINQWQQSNSDLYFAGGWTIGAGLHEECWHQGEIIAGKIVNGVWTNDHLYDTSRKPEHFAPAYMRHLRRR